MPQPRKTQRALAPQQARSRESWRKLMKATTEVMGQRGLDGTTIPRIARHAGLSPASVYRRFPDKTALLEAVVIDIYDRQAERLRSSLPRDHAKQVPLALLASQVVNSLIISYRISAGLLRALRHLVQTSGNGAFKRRVARYESRSFAYLVDTFLVHEGEMKHPSPRLAVSIGLMFVITTLVELIVMSPRHQEWTDMLPKNDDELKHELVTAFLRYLGSDEGTVVGAPGGRTSSSPA
jgi:AcrR family transcriptional regulator